MLRALEDSHRKTIGMALPDFLASTRNAPRNVCLKAIKMCHVKGFLDCRESVNFPKLTEKGFTFIKDKTNEK